MEKQKFKFLDKVKITSNPNPNTEYYVVDVDYNGIYGVMMENGKNIIAVHESEMVRVK